MSSSARVGTLLATLVAAAALALLAGRLLHLCSGPLGTSDVWFHLKMGEVYASQGPWPPADPLLHTAHADAPVQHEWLFGVALHAVDRLFGLHGLRVVHVLAVAGILWLAYSLFRRESAAPVDACLATCAFAVLAWWRLFQLRPDLFSIPAAFAIYRLLLEPGRPAGPGRIAASVLILLVWANVHSLFAIGLLLIAAALLGLGLRAALRRRMAGSEGAGEAAAGSDRVWARRLAAALGLGGLVTLLNPRGIWQHLTFLTSSRDMAIWAISDEWTHFDPFAWRGYGDAVSLPSFVVADAIMALFFAVALVGLGRLVRRPSAERLEPIDPLLLGLGLAGIVAALVSVRFLWMLAFALLFVLRARRLWAPPSSAAAPVVAPLLGVCALALALVFPRIEGFQARAARVPTTLPAYLSTAYDAEKFHMEAVRFLGDAELEGNLFNTYPMGGFLEYWLAPRLRAFVDGRTEHYEPDVLEDYFRITAMRGAAPDEGFLDVLERRNVDVFVGTGAPSAAAGLRYTSAHLERAPGWMLVSRSMRHGIYLRTNPRNRENRRRVESYYRREGVPFDPQRGLDPGRVIRERPDWAEAHGMVLPGYRNLLADRRSPDARTRLRALQRLGFSYALVGAYEEGVEVEREILALRPRAKGPRRRLVYDLLRLDRAEEALAEAQALQALDPRDRASAFFLRAARAYALRRAAPRAGADPLEDEPPEALINRLRL